MDKDNAQAWDDMELRSVFGGIALANAGFGAVHGFAGEIGGQTGAAHGAICGTLPSNVSSGSWSRSRAHGLPTIGALGLTAAMHADIAFDTV